MPRGLFSPLGYLKCRWACESILGQAARHDIPTIIFRGTMATPVRVPLDRADINRRIFAGSTATGCVPDVDGARGGGMSWISADFLAGSVPHYADRSLINVGRSRFYHLVSDQHVLYNQFPAVLGKDKNGQALNSVSPQQWFEKMLESGDVEIEMQAAVLEKCSRQGGSLSRLRQRRH
jgi:thioester reductase-like protein